MEKNKYTIIVYGENHIGLLNRITIIFTRRHINIDSLTVSKSEIDDVSRFTIVVEETEAQVKKVVDQIEKQIEVIKSFFFKDDETIFKEICLFKIEKTGKPEGPFMEMVEKHEGKVITGNDQYVIVEKTGRNEEIENFLTEIKEGYKLLQFVRSGRISISKSPMFVSTILKNFEENN